VAAIRAVDLAAARAVQERGTPWCYGADDLYLQAQVPLPAAAWYGEFEQRENGVGAVRFLQTRIAQEASDFLELRGKKIAVVTGTAMAPLMPLVLEEIRATTGAVFEVLALENSLFGRTVTTAGLLPGGTIREALVSRHDLDLALIPAEALSDDLLFIDGMHADALADLGMPVRPSYDFADVLADPAVWSVS
jgi:NifB/MoaA-like Fe-S oxidoreductase